MTRDKSERSAPTPRPKRRTAKKHGAKKAAKRSRKGASKGPSRPNDQAGATTTPKKPSAEAPFLSPQHQRLIEESSILSEVAAERGYRTVTSKAELGRLGFGDKQCRTPTLLIPINGTSGQLVTYQARPDTPRVMNGKALKYETPKGSRMAIDVPLRARQWLGDNKRPLFVTEGARKADAGVSQGLCTVALLGVWNWRGTNAQGGKATLPDWDDIALNGREVYIVFDSDVMTKNAVYQAMSRLKEMLKRRDAKVRLIYLEPAQGGTKAGLDDFFAAGGTVDLLLSRASNNLRKPPLSEAEKTLPYVETENGIVWHRKTNEGIGEVRLTNFTARITSEVEESDGVETTRCLEVTAKLAGRERTFEVPAAAFPSMNWVMAEVGAEAIIEPGSSLKDRTRVAIQHLSGKIPRQTVYTHTGWIKTDDSWHYLHGGGSIGPHGPQVQIHTRFSGGLEGYCFPDPRDGGERVADVQASLRLIDLGLPSLGYLLSGAVYRAVMGGTVSSVHLTGPTGTFKSEVAALAQSHWGPTFDGSHLPASWSSTENSLEALAFLAKDALLTIDDFAPAGTANDVARLHQKADRVLRAQGNRSGRGRLRKDLKPLMARPPRGLVLSTGEDTPSGQSIRARTTIHELSPGDIDVDVLTELQGHARNGALSRSLAAFVQWVAPDYEARMKGLSSRQVALRDEHRIGSHTRTPSNFAENMSGFELFMDFAVDVGAVTADQAEAHREDCRRCLLELGKAQVQHQNASEPTAVFLQLVSNALASGEANWTGLDGNAPPDKIADALGWKRHDDSSGSTKWRAQGERIGWIDGDDVFLLPAAAHKAAQGVASQTERLTIGYQVLGKRLAEKGLLAIQESTRKKHTVRKVIGGNRHTVLHMSATSFGFGAHEAHGSHVGAGDPSGGGDGPQTWAPNDSDGEVWGPQMGPTRPSEGGAGPDGPDGPRMDATPSTSESGERTRTWKG